MFRFPDLLIPVTQPLDEDWIFHPNGMASDAPNTQYATYKEGNIELAGEAVQATSVMQINPFGNLPAPHGAGVMLKSQASAAQQQAAVNNTNLGTIALGVNGGLALGDVRANYVQLGGIWTSDGSVPSTGDIEPDTELRGSLYLANSTMETFGQYTPPHQTGTVNCFSCHSDFSGTNYGVETSHIFDGLKKTSQ